jgi:LysM repeat protein
MNNDDAAHQAVLDAIEALRRGDKRSARRYAERAVFLGRDKVEPWLVLAETSSPRARIAYVQEALKIDPASPLAAQALRRAQARAQKQAAPAAQPPGELSPGSSPIPIIGPAKQTGDKKRPKTRMRLVQILALLAAAALVWLAWTRLTSGADPAASVALVNAQATTYTPGVTQFATTTVTPAPSRTATQVPTSTFTPTPTLPPTSTATPLPTSTATAAPSPTRDEHPQNIYSVKRGETLAKIAAKFEINLDDLIATNNLENTSTVRPGTRLVIPMNGSPAATQIKGTGAPAAVRNSGKSILVVISEQHMYAYEGKKLVFSFDVSTGRNGSTSAGTFSILDKIPNAWSAPWGFWMPNWMGIYYVGSNLENGFHSLPVLTNGQEIWGDEIGVPITYGCVVLDPNNMKRLFNWADIGTPVIIRH